MTAKATSEAGQARGPRADDPLVSILIPTRDNVGDLISCLDSIGRLQYPSNSLEVRLFDNGSSSDLSAIVRQYYRELSQGDQPRLIIERSERNLGAFGGRAAGGRDLADEVEFILSLDDDVELRDDALRVMISAMDSPQVGVVGARIVYHDAPDEVASAAGYLNRTTGTFWDRTPTETTSCDFVSSCGCLIRRTVFDQVGGFEGKYFTSQGDADLCLKAKRHGYEVVYEPAAVICHKVDRGGTRTPERVYFIYRNKILLLREHLPWWRLAMILPLYALFWAPKIIVDSLVQHRGIDRAEIAAILLALKDAAMGQWGERS